MKRREFMKGFALLGPLTIKAFGAEAASGANLQLIDEIPARRKKSFPPGELHGSTAENFQVREIYYEELK